MTQDQYGQARGSGYARDDAPGEQTQEFPAEQSKPMTRLQKVASALRGADPDRDEADRDQPAATGSEAAAGISREARQRDYWDEPGAPAAEAAEAVEVTRPDGPVAAGQAGRHAATAADSGLRQGEAAGARWGTSATSPTGT